MARLMTVGFELNSATAGIEVDTISGAPTISSTTMRSGLYAGRVNTSGRVSFQHQVNLTGTAASLYQRVYLYIATLPNADTAIVTFRDNSDTPTNGIVLRTTGALAFYRAGPTQVGSDTAAIATGTWVCLELHYEQSVANEARLNGVVIGTTATTAAVNATSIEVGANLGLGFTSATTLDLFFDDWAVNDNTGSLQNNYPGEGKVIYFRPYDVGDNTGWTGVGAFGVNYANMADRPPDDVSTYVRRTTTGVKTDDYKMEPYNAGGAATPATIGIAARDAITLVQVGVRGGATSATDALGRDIFTRIKSAASGTVIKSAGPGLQGTSGGTSTKIKQNVNGWTTNGTVAPQLPALTAYTDPTTGVAWTRDGTNSLNNMQVGVETENSSTTEVRCTAIWAIVEYVPTPVVPTEVGRFAVPRSGNF